MSSAFAAEFEAAALPDLLTTFGETVRQHPGGVDPWADVTAIVAFDDARPEMQAGQAVDQTGTLEVPDATTCTVQDEWLVRGVRYGATAVEPAENGLMCVRIRRREVETRREPAGGYL